MNGGINVSLFFFMRDPGAPLMYCQHLIWTIWHRFLPNAVICCPLVIL